MALRCEDQKTRQQIEAKAAAKIRSATIGYVVSLKWLMSSLT